MRFLFVILLEIAAGFGLLGADRATFSGKIVDNSGQPVQHATVLIYHAGVKTGYSIFCPSCYSDCGKRAITNAGGGFVFQNVDSNLWFELLAVRDGFEPVFIKKVDPLSQTPAVGVLSPRAAPDAQRSVVRGRIVDENGVPLRDAVIEPVGISTTQLFGGKLVTASTYGEIKGLEPIAVSNDDGDFELASDKQALGMLLKVEARGFAPKFAALPTGADRKKVAVYRGATIRGRLVKDGKPVSGAEIGLISSDRGGFGNNLKIIGNPYDEMRVGTQVDGSFVLADVPAPVNWYVYAKMESISSRGATEPVLCTTKDAGELVNVGDIQVKPGYRLSGTVVLSDGKRIPGGMRVSLSADRAWDSQTVLIQPDGGFEFFGLPAGNYEVWASVQGYGSREPNRNVSIDHDIRDFSLLLQPDSRP